MAEETMGGPDRVAVAVRDRLAQQVPVELGLLEASRGRPTAAPTDPDEPDLWRLPQLYAAEDRPRLEPEDYPAILVAPVGSLAARVEDMLEGRPVLRVPYRLQALVFVRHWGWQEVQAAQRRMATAVISALFRQRHLGAGLELMPQGWTTSYSPVGYDDNDTRSYAGWAIEFVVEQVEQLGDVMLAPQVPGDPLDLQLRVHPAAD